jgi:hypothetical protein
MWLLWWPKNTSTTKSSTGGEGGGGTASATATAMSTSCLAGNGLSSDCCCLRKLVKKLKRQNRSLGAASRQSSFQCRYDPLSYSLNFNPSGSGSLLDEDYHQFYSFSSRFVANPRTASCPTLVPTASI